MEGVEVDDEAISDWGMGGWLYEEAGGGTDAPVRGTNRWIMDERLCEWGR